MQLFGACLVTSASTHIIVCLTEANTTLQAMPKPRAKTSPALLAREKQQAKIAKTEQAKQKKQQQQQPAAKASKKYSSSAKPKTADLPIHIPDHVPLCETCEQPYGSNDKDALPEQRPLKWRSFNIKQIQQDIVGPRLPWESTWEAL